MTPRPDNTDPVAAESEVEANDPVDEVKDTEGAKDAASKGPANDEVEKSDEKKDTTDDVKKDGAKEEEAPAKVEEESTPKSPEEVRNAFDPFFNSNDDAADEIAKESADAAKELASLFK